MEGYRQALLKHEVGFDENLVRDCGAFEQNGYDAMRSWITEGNLPRRVFAANDRAAIGWMSALHEAGIGVPEKVAVCRLRSHSLRVPLRVPLTTVDWDLIEMGQQAARLLIETIEGNQSKTDKQRNIVVEPKLVVRSSCGAVTNLLRQERTGTGR